MPDKFVVRQNHQLTSCQTYVYCASEATAKAVADRFAKEPESTIKYKWADDAPRAPKEHWCVTRDTQWVIAKTSDVRMGQWYIGIWSGLVASTVLADVRAERYRIDGYKAGVGPIKEAGYVIVNAHEHAFPVETWCYRRDLVEGDCYEYLDNPGKCVVSNVCIPGLPPDWYVSTASSARDNLNRKVKRIPRWDNKGPVILPCIDPLDRLVNGMALREIAYRYGEAQKHDAIRRTDGKKFVDRHDIFLDSEQFAAAPEAWSILLRAKFVTTADIERHRVVLEDQDELPNMVTVDGDA